MGFRIFVILIVVGIATPSTMCAYILVVQICMSSEQRRTLIADARETIKKKNRDEEIKIETEEKRIVTIPIMRSLISNYEKCMMSSEGYVT